MLVVKLKSGDGRSASYYTRVVVNDNYHESQLLNAAKDFHDATFAFDKLESESVIGTYKQEYTGGGTGDSYGLGHVNLANAYSDRSSQASEGYVSCYKYYNIHKIR